MPPLLVGGGELIEHLGPLPQRRKGKRPIGLAKGEFKVPPEFFEPLPSELLDAFNGQEP